MHCICDCNAKIISALTLILPALLTCSALHVVESSALFYVILISFFSLRYVYLSIRYSIFSLAVICYGVLLQ